MILETIKFFPLRGGWDQQKYILVAIAYELKSKFLSFKTIGYSQLYIYIIWFSEFN